MKRIMTVCSLALAVSAFSADLTTEEATRKEIMQRYPFTDPQAGSKVSLQMLNGAVIDGEIITINNQSITIKTESGISVTHDIKSIHPYSKAFLFREDYEKALDYEVQAEIQRRELAAQQQQEYIEKSPVRFFGVMIGEKIPASYSPKAIQDNVYSFLPPEDMCFSQNTDNPWIYTASVLDDGRVYAIAAHRLGKSDNAPEFFNLYESYLERYNPEIKVTHQQPPVAFRQLTVQGGSVGSFSAAALSATTGSSLSQSSDMRNANETQGGLFTGSDADYSPENSRRNNGGHSESVLDKGRNFERKLQAQEEYKRAQNRQASAVQPGQMNANRNLVKSLDDMKRFKSIQLYTSGPIICFTYENTQSEQANFNSRGDTSYQHAFAIVVLSPELRQKQQEEDKNAMRSL